MVGKPRLLSQMHEQISLNTTRFALRESTATVRSWPVFACHQTAGVGQKQPIRCVQEIREDSCARCHEWTAIMPLIRRKQQTLLR